MNINIFKYLINSAVKTVDKTKQWKLICENYDVTDGKYLFIYQTVNNMWRVKDTGKKKFLTLNIQRELFCKQRPQGIQNVHFQGIR